MQLRQLTDTLSVSGQIDEADVDLLAAQGFRSLINNRPDGEAAGQPVRPSLRWPNAMA